MGAMTAVVSRTLRLDDATWRRVSAVATTQGAALLVLGSYLVLALSRFGMQGLFEPRAAVRMLLTGAYGWMWLVGATWAIARVGFRSPIAVRSLFPVIGHAHLPLLLVAIFIQFVSVSLAVLGPARWAAVLAAVWIPAMLIAATRNATRLSLRDSVVAAGLPYVAWAAVVGRTMWIRVEHLL